MDFDNVFFKSINFFLVSFSSAFGKVGFIVTTVKACSFCQDTCGEGKRKKVQRQ